MMKSKNSKNVFHNILTSFFNYCSFLLFFSWPLLLPCLHQCSHHWSCFWCFLHHNVSTTTAVLSFCCPHHHLSVDCCLFQNSFFILLLQSLSLPLVQPLLLLSPSQCTMVLQAKLLLLLAAVVAVVLLPVDFCFGFLFATMVVAILPVCCHCSAVTIFAPPCTTVLLMPLLLLSVVNITTITSHSGLLLFSSFIVHMPLHLLHPLLMIPPIVFAVVAIARLLYHGLKMPLQ